MLLEKTNHLKLLKVPWIIRRVDGKTFYLKYIFEEAQYVLLITDLCLVWSEHGNYERIKENAKVPNIDIESEGEAVAVLVRVKKLFLDNIGRCTIKRGQSGKLKVHCTPNMSQIQNRINTLSWIFDCDLLNQEADESNGSLSGPQVIYQHFIQPSQAIVNYFTENMSDENEVKIKMVKASESLYSTTSLSYMTAILQNDEQQDNTSTPVTQNATNETNTETNRIPCAMTPEELEAKRLSDLQRQAQEERARRMSAMKRRKL